MARNRFVYHRPTTLGQALELVAEHGARARVLAGGTDLVRKLRVGAVECDHLIGLRAIRDLHRIGATDGKLFIGAGVRISEVARYPLVTARYPALARACTLMATTQIRNMGTVAGNLANGSPCADTAGPLLVYSAELVLASRGGSRHLPVTAMFRGPGVVDIAPDEIIETIQVPTPPERSGSAYLRLSARSRVDMAAVSVAGQVALEPDGRIAAAALALGAVGPTPLRCPAAEALLVGQTPTDDLLDRSADECRRAALPIDDIRATADYRRDMCGVLARRVLDECLRRARSAPAATGADADGRREP